MSEGTKNAPVLLSPENIKAAGIVLIAHLAAANCARIVVEMTCSCGCGRHHRITVEEITAGTALERAGEAH